MLSKVAKVEDGVQTVKSLGLANGRTAALLIIFRQPGANIITTVDSIKKALPQLHAAIDPSIIMSIGLDQTQTIRASVADIERTLVLSVLLVVLVVFVFLREWRATLIPLVAVPTSIIATLGAMYLLGYSIDNLSLMALTISTGFVVDDAIVVLENITRYQEQGLAAEPAAMRGAAEIGSTVLSMSISLVAVFIPYSAHGRHHRPAVPRVRRGAIHCHPDLARGLAHHHAHDVLHPVEARAATTARSTRLANAFFRSCSMAMRKVWAGFSITPSWCYSWPWVRWSSPYSCTSKSPRVSSRSRIPGASTAPSWPTNPFPFRPCNKRSPSSRPS